MFEFDSIIISLQRKGKKIELQKKEKKLVDIGCVIT